jgi:hypothetical protein
MGGILEGQTTRGRLREFIPACIIEQENDQKTRKATRGPVTRHVTAKMLFTAARILHASEKLNQIMIMTGLGGLEYIILMRQYIHFAKRPVNTA